MRKNILRLTSVFMLTAFCLTLFQAVSVGADERRPLLNTIYRLQNKMPLSIGYFGGSITLGSGASSESNNFRAKTTKWFKDTYPESQITEINAAIGGFGSQPNAFRAKSHLLVKNPDLVFVEAAVNDWNANEKEVKDSMEGVVRQIYEHNPKADIVFIYTTRKDAAEVSYANGQMMKTVLWHEEIAKHYGILSVNVGDELFEKVNSGEYPWESLLGDGTHPNDTGYELYTQSLTTFLKRELQKDAPSAPADYKMPVKLSPSCYDKADIIDSWDMTFEGFDKSENSMGGRHPHMIISNKKDSVASVAFKGRSVGLYWLKSNDAGIVEWWIDGGTPKTISGCDELALTGSARGTFNMLATNLSDGEHILNLRVTGEKDSGSKDAWIRIGGVFVSERSSVKAPLPKVTSAPVQNPTPDETVFGASYVPKYERLFKAVGIIFRPGSDDTVTRGEAAAAVASMLKTGTITASGQIFDDVAPDNPAYNAVGVLKSLGIISGSGGSFYPDNPISKNEAIKLMVSAAGYNPLALQNGGYPHGYTNVAVSMGILKSVGLGSEVSPNDFEALIYNTINTDMFEAESFGERVSYSIQKGVTILTKYHNIYSDRGVVTGTSITSLGGYLKAPRDFIRINDSLFNLSADYNEYLGYRVKYYYFDDDSKDKQIVFLERTATEIKSYLTEDIRDYKDNTYTLTNDFGGNEQIKIFAFADVIYNNKRIDKEDIYMVPSNGTVEVIDNNQDGIFDVVKIFDYTPVVVSGTSLDEYAVYNLITPGEKISLKENNYSFANTLGVRVDFEDILKFDVISMAVSLDGEFASGIVTRMYISGVIDEINEGDFDSSISIDGLEYLLSPVYNIKDIKLGTIATFYLDHFEKIVYCAQSKPTNAGYAYVMGRAFKSDIRGNRAILKILDSDGEIKEISSRSTILYNDISSDAAQVVENLRAYNGIINYKVDSKGDITQIYTAVESKSVARTGLYSSNISGTSYYYRASTLNFGNKHVMSGNTVIFSIPTYSDNDEDYKLMDYTALKSGEFYTIAAYRTDPNKLTCDFVVWFEDGGDNTRYTTPITLVERKTSVINERGETVEKLYGTSKGNAVTYVSFASGLFDGVTPGDVIRCLVGANGMVVKEPQIIYDFETDTIKTAVGSNTSSNPWVLKGRVHKVDGDIISLYTGTFDSISQPALANLFLFSINDRRPITLFDGTRPNDKIMPVTKHFIRDYESSGAEASTIIAILNYGEHDELLIFKRGV